MVRKTRTDRRPRREMQNEIRKFDLRNFYRFVGDQVGGNGPGIWSQINNIDVIEYL